MKKGEENILHNDRKIFLILSCMIIPTMLFYAFIGRVINMADKNPKEAFAGPFVPLIIMTLVCGAVTVLGMVTRKIQLFAAINSGMMIILILPFTVNAFDDSSYRTFIWYVTVALYIVLLLYGVRKYIMLGLLALSGAGVYIYGAWWIYQENPFGVREVVGYIVSYLVLAFVCALICIMVSIEMRSLKKAAESTADQKKEIETLNKAQNRFFSSMSHEIRTPINTIIGLNEMILREDISDEVAEDARNIQSASKMLLSLINDILDMSKIESGQMTFLNAPYKTGDMLSDIVGMIWIRAKEKDLRFHVDIDPHVPGELIGDEMRIKQILINVLNNAVKYTAEGSVTLSISFHKTEENKCVMTYTVTDTGIGIRKESIPYLFTAFKRVDEENNKYIEGTGLGLSIVKQLVDAMGGSINVNSIYTKGSTFMIEIPQEMVAGSEVGELNLEKRGDAAFRKEYKQKLTAADAKVLIVDDDSANLLVETKLLRDTLVKTDTAKSGAEALEKTLNNEYDLIFMDHMMPEMDGIECLHRIREQEGGLNRQTKIAVLTANAGSKERELYAREGFDAYIVKPVSGEQLEDTLIKLLPRDLIKIEGTEFASEQSSVFEDIELKRRKPLIITSETVCDLPRQMLAELGIPVIAYHVETAEGDFFDGNEAEGRGIASYLQESGKAAASQHPSVEEYESFFARELLHANNIIHISMSRKVGKGFYNAAKAAESFDNVRVIDSCHLSSGMGLFVLEAVRLAKESITPDELITKLKGYDKMIHTSFIVEDTEYMARGGRISRFTNTIAKSFYFHPELLIRNGKLVIGSLFVGDAMSVWSSYVRTGLFNPSRIDDRLLFVTYSGLTSTDIKEIDRLIRKRVNFKRIIYQKASSAISANCGPGTFGLLYLYKH